MFDCAVSLGQACDVSSQIRRCMGQNGSFPFDWLITPFEALLENIQSNFKDFLNIDNLQHEHHYIIDVSSGVKFLHDFPDLPNFVSSLPSVQEKYGRRIERWNRCMEQKSKILFIRSQQYIDNDIIDKEKAIRLWNVINKSYPNVAAHLLIVNPEGSNIPAVNEAWLTMSVIPTPDPYIFYGDNLAWSKLINRFK